MNNHKKTLNFMQLLSNFKIENSIKDLRIIFKNAAKILNMDRIILYENIDNINSKVITIYSSYSDEKLKENTVVNISENINLSNTIKTKKISTIPVPDIGEDIALVINNGKYILSADDIDEARLTSKIEHIYFEFLAKATENAINILESKNSIEKLLNRVIKSKKSIEKLLIKAFTDKLTKSLNRAALDEHIDYNRNIHGIEYSTNPIAVLFIDIDHFKMFNDLHGHNAGDKVLIKVFETLKNTVRENSIVYRYGGEEIAIVVLSGIPEDIAEDCRKNIESLKIPWNNLKLDIRISIGVSKNKNTGIACKEADHALYYSKEHGRNKVTVYSKEIEEWFQKRS